MAFLGMDEMSFLGMDEMSFLGRERSTSRGEFVIRYNSFIREQARKHQQNKMESAINVSKAHINRFIRKRDTQHGALAS